MVDLQNWLMQNGDRSSWDPFLDGLRSGQSHRHTALEWLKDKSLYHVISITQWYLWVFLMTIDITWYNDLLKLSITNWYSKVATSINNWLVVSTPLKNMTSSVGSHKIPWFQTTNQITHYKVFSMSLCNKLPEGKYTANQLFEDDSPVS